MKIRAWWTKEVKRFKILGFHLIVCFHDELKTRSTQKMRRLDDNDAKTSVGGATPSAPTLSLSLCVTSLIVATGWALVLRPTVLLRPFKHVACFPILLLVN